MKNLIERCNINVGRIFASAWRKLGARLEQPGGVNARVLRAVIAEGAFCDDELAAEYFGGILAAARGEDLSDDRATTFLALVRDMSIYQIRLHYLCYSVL